MSVPEGAVQSFQMLGRRGECSDTWGKRVGDEVDLGIFSCEKRIAREIGHNKIDSDEL